MNRPARMLDLRVDVRPEEVARYLGYPGAAPATTRVEMRLTALWPEAMARVAPRGAFALIGRDDAASAGMPDPADTVGVAACTIGRALEDQAQELAARGAVLDAMLLDAIGSAAAEAAADGLNLELCRAAEAQGREASARVSPGYGDWPTACQPALLALLPAGGLGIELTSGAMMVPRKSVSFAVNFVATGAVSGHPASRCERCGLLRCRHRRHETPGGGDDGRDSTTA